ncbi:MAG: DUF2141 domain-containing protein, partial [Phaeodactylibacter sp.]|nr:DUF2141 domain-containing protein [Phaeodactylibacter sp.]
MTSVLWTFLIFSFMAPALNTQPELILEIQNVEVAEGTLRIGVFDKPGAFPNDDAVLAGYYFKVTQTGTIQISLRDLPFGDYAIAFHHDVNDDGKLDKNFFGVPTEPYTFSNNPSAKWRQPRFEEARFSFKEDKQILS